MKYEFVCIICGKTSLRTKKKKYCSERCNNKHLYAKKMPDGYVVDVERERGTKKGNLIKKVAVESEADILKKMSEVYENTKKSEIGASICDIYINKVKLGRIFHKSNGVYEFVCHTVPTLSKHTSEKF